MAAEAMTWYSRAIGEADWHRNLKAVDAMVNLGLALREAGRIDEAERRWSRALELFRSADGDRRLDVANVLGNLGVLAEDRGDGMRAIELGEEAYASGPPRVLCLNGR